MSERTRTRRLLLPAIAVAVLVVAAWQGRRLFGASQPARGAHTDSGSSSSSVVPQGSERGDVRVQAEGRLVTYPGAQVTVGSEIGGRIVRLTVNEKDMVRRGQLIAQLDNAELRAEYAEAQAHMNEAEADLQLFEADLARLAPLAADSVVSKQSLDRTRHDRDAAVARREEAQAAMQRLDAAIAKTRIIAPISGQVVTRYTNEGETVSPGAPIVQIADLRRVRVEAEVDEYDALRIALGDRATITAEGSDGTWHGHVEEIPDAVVGRRINPQDPGRPTDVRVLVAKIALDSPPPLKLGQRVEVVIEQKSQSVSGDTGLRR